MKNRTHFIIQYRWPIILFFLGLTFFFARQIPKAQMNPDMMTYLPEDMASRVEKNRIEDLFGGTEMIMLLVESDDVLQPTTLQRVKKISRQMKRVNGVDKVLSLFELKHIKGEDGAMIVDPAVKRIPKTDAGLDELRRDIQANDIVYGNVISKDFTVTAVIGMVEQGTSDETLLEQVQAIIDNNPGDETLSIGGTPYSRYNTGLNTKKDLGRLLPIGLLVMLIFLFFCFKQLRGVLLPFAVVLMSIFVSMGLIPLFGWQITVISIILPVILIAVANDYGIHMIARFQEDNTVGNKYSAKELARRMFSSLGLPIVLTGVTTMAGMLCLKGHIMIPAGQLGVLAAVGIAFALAASLLFIPAVVSLLRVPKSVLIDEHSAPKKVSLQGFLTGLGHVATRRPGHIVVISLGLTLIISLGAFKVQVNTDPMNYYDANHPVRQSAQMINQHLGGFFPVSIVFQGDIKDPIVLNKIDRLEREIESWPEVGNTSSIARVVRQMSRVLNDSTEAGFDQIPETRNGVAQYFELYNMSGDPEDFEKMVDFNYEHAIITARINTSSTPVLHEVVKRIERQVAGDSDVAFVGGIAEVFSDLAMKVVEGQFVSLGIALVIVALLIMLMFRSITAGLMATVPLALSMLIVFGLMGLLNIELNVATALLSSIMIGVGIDYTIHYLWRFKEERQRGLDHAAAARRTLLTTGRGIFFNALSVIIGFSALMLSSFVPVRFFGFLVVISIFSCLLGALVFIPALCMRVKPRFLEPKNEAVGL